MKKSGLEIKIIKQFMQWCEQGSETYIQRKNLFVKQKETVEAEIERLKHVLDVIEYKCWYYDEAIKDGNEDRLKTMKIEDMPDKIREIYLKMHNMSKDN